MSVTNEQTKDGRANVRRDLVATHYTDEQRDERSQVDAEDIERARNLWYALAPHEFVHLLDAHTSYEMAPRVRRP